MPLITIYSSSPLPAEEKAKALLQKLSSSAAEILAKPERYMMTCLVPETRMTFGGSFEPACAVEIKSIGGLAGDRAKRLSAAVCDLVHEGLGVAKDRIFLVCTDVPAHFWGFDGDTLG